MGSPVRRTSVGSWCVIENTERRVITSPEFIGAFRDLGAGLLSPDLGDIVRRRSSSGGRLINDAAVVWLLANTHGRSVSAPAPPTVVADTRLLGGALIAKHSGGGPSRPTWNHLRTLRRDYLRSRMRCSKPRQ